MILTLRLLLKEELLRLAGVFQVMVMRSLGSRSLRRVVLSRALGVRILQRRTGRRRTRGFGSGRPWRWARLRQRARRRDQGSKPRE